MEITSFSHPLVKHIKRLQRKKYRQKEGAFYIDGLPQVLTAIEYHASIEVIVFCEKLLTHEAGQSAIAQQRAKAVPCVALSEDIFDSISHLNTPAGIGAIAKNTWRDLETLKVKPTDIFVAFVQAAYPGNLGAILRTMAAMGAGGLILVGQSTDPFHPATVRASVVTLFTVPVIHVPDMATLQQWARIHNLTTIATSAKASQSYWETTYRFPALLLIGNEHTGLDAATIQAADQFVTIPMQGAASSLNVSVATSLILYELRRIAPQPVQGTVNDNNHKT